MPASSAQSSICSTVRASEKPVWWAPPASIQVSAATRRDGCGFHKTRATGQPRHRRFHGDRVHGADNQPEPAAEVYQRRIDGGAGSAVEDQPGRVGFAADAQRVDFNARAGSGN